MSRQNFMSRSSNSRTANPFSSTIQPSSAFTRSYPYQASWMQDGVSRNEVRPDRHDQFTNRRHMGMMSAQQMSVDPIIDQINSRLDMLEQSRVAQVVAHIACSSSGGLDGNTQLLSSEQLSFCKQLEAVGQGHLFDGWAAGGTDDQLKLDVVQQLMMCDSAYPGGLDQYAKNARALLAQSAAGANPLDGYMPSVPAGEVLTAHTPEWHAAEALGLEHIGSCVFGIVAGGLGERLGYNGIKLALPAESCSGKSFIEYYISTILAYQRHASAQQGKDLQLPLMIMTSDDTDTPTRALLTKHSNFGMADGQVVILKQDKVPSICDNEGRIALAADGYGIQTKPHGHGDVHQVLHASGLIPQWRQKGFKHLFLFQDTNFFCLRTGLVGLGVSVANGFDMNSMCVPRKPGEAIGGICRLRGDGLPELTINVEYNQIDALLRSTEEFKAGDVADPATGLSMWPGSINELLFNLETYEKVLNASGGAVPEFVNPKYADASKTSFKSPTRLECMMQDLPRLFTNNEKVGFTSLNRPGVRQYSPVKNQTAEAAKKQQAGLDPAAAASGEIDVYKFHCDCLNAGGKGMQIGDTIAATFDGIKLDMSPMVVLTPGFVNQIETKVFGGSLGSGATLIVDGDDIVLDNVTVGPGSTLIVKADVGCQVVLKDQVFENSGKWELVALTEHEKQSFPEESLIRGFKVVKHPGYESHQETLA